MTSIDKLKKEIKKIADKNEKIREQTDTKLFMNEWKDSHLPNPLDIVRQFISEKGLKLYGGQALNDLLKPHKAAFYKSSQLPDYDVFSPDAWNHAKELANKMNALGFPFVEARSSVLNDEHHSTYKVAIDSTYILDLTQSGCTIDQVKKGDCDTCGRGSDGTCHLLFDHIPALDVKSNLKSKHPKIYRKTYNEKTGKAIYPKKMFIADPDWLKQSMYRELTEPFAQPDRFPKVATRFLLFQKYYKFKPQKCSKKEYNMEMLDPMNKKIIQFIGKYIKNKKLVNYGASAHNMFVKDVKNIGKLTVSNYKVYTLNSIYHIVTLIELLKKKFPKRVFKSYEKHLYWKEMYDEDYIIAVKTKKGHFNNLITFTELEKCIPYIKYNGVRYATVNRLKHLYYRAAAIPKFIEAVEEDPLNYRCLLTDLLKAERLSNKKSKIKSKINLNKRSKFRQMVSVCQGEDISKRYVNLTDRWIEKMKTLKKTKYYYNKPKKGYMTKVYKMADKELYLPYRPEEQQYKTKRRYKK